MRLAQRTTTTKVYINNIKDVFCNRTRKVGENPKFRSMVECSLSLFSSMVKGQKQMISTSTHSDAKKNSPHFALLHMEEIQKLGEQKASGTTIRIYMVLCAYAMNGCFCFPKYQSIAESAGIKSKTFQQIISRSLLWLSKHHFIEKSSNKKSKQRYFLSLRHQILSLKQSPQSQKVDRTNRDLSSCDSQPTKTKRTLVSSSLRSSAQDLPSAIISESDHCPTISGSFRLNKSANSNIKKLNKSANIRDKQEKIISIPPLTPPKGGEEINIKNNNHNYSSKITDPEVRRKPKTNQQHIHHNPNTSKTQNYRFANPSSIMSKCMAVFPKNTHTEVLTNKYLEEPQKHHLVPENNKETNIETNINDLAQKCFEQKIAQKLPLNIKDIQILQTAMQQNTQWYNWITGFHFSYYQSIMGYQPSDDEIKIAQNNWLKSEENKQIQHQEEIEKERIVLRNKRIERQLGISQIGTAPKEKELENNTKKRKEFFEKKPSLRNKKERKNRERRKKRSQKYNNFDGGTSHPEYWPARPAVEKMVSDLIVQQQNPNPQESLYIRTYANKNQEWYHWLRYHQPNIFGQVFNCLVTNNQQEKSHQIWNQLVLEKLGFNKSF
jgi:hypothetical protein